jgi:hypothetical protein
LFDIACLGQSEGRSSWLTRNEGKILKVRELWAIHFTKQTSKFTFFLDFYLSYPKEKRPIEAEQAAA